MRKMNWLIGSIALGVGLVIGVFGYALATTPVDGDSRLVSFLGDKNLPLNLEGGTSQDPSYSANSPNPYNPLDPSGNSQDGSLGYPSSASGEGTVANPDGTAPNMNSNVQADLAQKIIADYKQDVGFFFEAWKSPEMVSFRSKLAKAYKGDLYEKHARQAENFIIQGIGIEASEIYFERINVESATANAATLTAQYRYVAQDYSIADQAPYGQKTEHTVNVRVNLVKENSRWLITGETEI